MTRPSPQDATAREDRSWSLYPATVLEIGHGEEAVRIDLGAPVNVTQLPFAGSPFGVVTACNPRGRRLSREENAARDRRLADTLARASVPYLRAIGRSRDGAHEEPGFALLAPRDEVIAIADTFEQTAIFWFDGESFWLWPVHGEPVRLPHGGHE